MAQLGGQVAVRQLIRKIQPAAHGFGLQVEAEIFTEITGETSERVVLRVHGPDQAVEIVDEFAWGFRDPGGEGLGFLHRLGRLQGEITEQHDFRQSGTEVIVHVTGDAGALFFDDALLFEPREFLLQSSFSDRTDADGDEADE